MTYRVWAALALLQLGCASNLDFDSVSSGRHDTDAAVHVAVHTVANDVSAADAAPAPEDAGTRPVTPTAAFAEAAGSSATAPVHDAGIVFSRDAGTADAAPVVATADPTAFSCSKLSPKPYFCDDFESLGLSSHWSTVAVQPTDPVPGGSIYIDESAALAGHSSLLAQIDQGLPACNNCIDVFAGMTLPKLQGPSKLTAEFDLRAEQVDAIDGRRIAVFQVWWGTPQLGYTQHTLQLGSSDGALWTGLVEIATDAESSDSNDPIVETFSDHQWQQTPLLSQWVHVVYTLEVQDALGTANVARLTVGDVVLFDGPLSFALPNAKASLELGVPWLDMQSFEAQETSQAWRVRFDNVLVRYEPR